MVKRVVKAAFILALALALTFLLHQGVAEHRRGMSPSDRPLPPISVTDRPLRIVALGTSLTRRAVWPEKLERRLQGCLPQGAEVTVRAKAGAASDWGVAQVPEVLALRHDLMVVEFAINDGDVLDGLSLTQSRDNIQSIVTRFQRDGAAVLLLMTNPVGRLAALRRPFLAAYQDLYPEVARATGAGVLDGEWRWRHYPGWRAALADGVHPDPMTEAHLMVPALTLMIATAVGRDCPPAGNP